MTRSCEVNAFNYDWSEDAGYANPPWSLITRVLRKLCSEGARVILVFPEWPNAPWYPIVRELELRSFLVTSPCYLSPRMYLRHKHRLNARIAIVDGAAATPRVHRTLGTQPPAKRVRFNHQTAIHPIPSCKETAPGTIEPKPTTLPPQVLATTERSLALGNNQAFTKRKPTSTAHSTLTPNPRIARVGSFGTFFRWLTITGRF